MEKQLREIVRNFENDLNAVNWETYPLPILQSDSKARPSPVIKHEEKFGLGSRASRLEEVKLPSSYKIVEQEKIVEKPSKAMEIAKKRMEKL